MTVFVTFTSDLWSIVIIFVADPCQFSFNSDEDNNGGQVISPGWYEGDGGYPSDGTCSYSFRSKGAERVQIIFEEFVMYRPPDTAGATLDGKDRP